MTTYYKFDSESNTYISTGTKPIDPVETKLAGYTVYAGLGKCETTEAPPPYANNQIPQWTGNNWILIDDYRGQYWYDENGFEVQIEDVGTPNNNLTITFTKPITNEDVNFERDRRISNGFICPVSNTYHFFQFRPDDKMRISGAVQLATLAIMAGANTSDYYWHGANTPFVWIVADNTRVPMTAYDMIEVGKTSAYHESILVFKANDIKNLANGIPSDYTDDKYWT